VLGARAAVLGVLGRDASGNKLRELLESEGIETSLVIEDRDRPTTTKTRYVSRTSQVLRVDQEDRSGIAGSVERRILEHLATRPFPYQAVLLSDYGKGVLTPAVIQGAIEAAHSCGGLAVVDPKGVDYSIYCGADLLTPNREEAEAATGVSIRELGDLHRVAQRLRELTSVRTAIITLGRDGIFFETETGESRVIPTEARAVFDVTGAGDTVAAVLTLARTSGVDLSESVHLANLAAGIVVGRFGTWAVSRQDLLSLLGQSRDGKVITPEEAVSVAVKLRTEGRRLVFTNGCFDILHRGHTEYLARARNYGDALLVAVNEDQSVRRLQKAPGRPVNPLAERMAVLAALQVVDFVVPFAEEDPSDLIVKLTPEILVKGEDWRERGVVGREWVEAHGGQVVLVPLVEGCSTTAIIDRILDNCDPS
jgi:D-beta-D-heptose 7-phosphate kinase/D-beta-D-heptose 1-phosphate adenosyltransferase